MYTGLTCRIAAGVILHILMATSSSQTAPIEGEKALQEYAGVYQWGPNALVYLQLWAEFTGKQQLVAFDESGDVRVLSPTNHDHFFTGPSAAVSSRIEFQRDAQESDACVVRTNWITISSPGRTAPRGRLRPGLAAIATSVCESCRARITCSDSCQFISRPLKAGCRSGLGADGFGERNYQGQSE